MTWQIVRAITQVQVVKLKPGYKVGAETTFQVVRAPGGPRGVAAAQDFGWSLTGGLAAGETINGPPLPHPATYAAIYAHSDSGFLANQTITVRQVRAGSVVASATLAVTTTGHDWANTSITPLAFLAGDVPRLVLPSPADSQATDLSVSLGSTP